MAAVSDMPLTITLASRENGGYGGLRRPSSSNAANFSKSCAAAHDFEKFAALELEGRRSPPYPPFSRLANVIVSGMSETAAMELAQSAGAWLHALVGRRHPG